MNFQSKKIVVVGGVAGGASFAARMRRLDESANIVMFERGEYISFANCGLPYHIGGDISQRSQLILQTPESFNTRFNVDVRTKTEVIGVNTSRKCVTFVSNGSVSEEDYDYLILSPGALPVVPATEGVGNHRVFTLRTIPDTDKIIRFIQNGNIGDALVVGGGFIGLEMAENLRQRGLEVTLVEASDQLFSPMDPEMAYTVNQHLKANGVKVILGDSVQSFSETENGKFAALLQSGTAVKTSLVILAIGVRPDTQFLSGSGIRTNSRGAIIVNDQLQTNVEQVFALGDAVEITQLVSGARVTIPLAGPANRQGRIVADNIAGFDSKYRGTQATSICKMFDLTAAVTGLNEKTAKAAELQFLKSYTHSANHASYYPGASLMSVKLIFSPEDGVILGGQVTGKEGVDKRVDLLATAVRNRLTIYDLADSELAYAPPYGSAKDPLNIAGFVAQNILNHISPVCYSEQVKHLFQNGYQILDVRTKREFGHGRIEGALNIPIDELRNRLNELDGKRPVLVYCQVGLRGHLGVRILLQNRFRAVNLSGGYKTYKAYQESLGKESIITLKTTEKKTEPVIINACGLQCPQPVNKLGEAIGEAEEGEIVEILANDQAFASNLSSWCAKTGNLLISLAAEKGVYNAAVQKRTVTKESGSEERK
ncbi:CoA-disulfide reductase [Chitinispirillum alkaliphilum]|nr:CoA-disulfide reductase [Chitinispirillum alkaliphilum]